ncbi:MAG: TlpA family protein disulfide reductase [Phyllobacteriaceae bacterium]|nr:TlpA family protein disulfide reductase [Phyllobacteriaceae bacterium]
MKRRDFLLVSSAAILAPPLVFARDRPPSAVELARPLDPPRMARGLVMTDEAGAVLSIGSYSGKLVLLNLWGPWCAPCRREMPSLSRLAASNDPEKLAIIPLAFDWRGAKAVRSFYDELAIANLPVVMGKGENADAVLGLSRLPTTALIDREGNGFAAVAGEATWDDDATIAWLAKLAG